MIDQNNFFEKYGLVLLGTERFYFLNLNERRMDLEFSIPQLIVIEDQKFKIHDWSNLICNVANYLQSKYPKQKEELLNFKTDWSKSLIFTETKCHCNCKELETGLFVNINHTALHSVWIISDLLRFYTVDLNDCFLLIHKASNFEPTEIQNLCEKECCSSFSKYLKSQRILGEEYIDKIIRSINVLNKILDKMSCSYKNFFLFDSNTQLSVYKSKLLLDLGKYVSWNDRQIKLAHTCLDYLTDFFTFRKSHLEVYEKEVTIAKPNGKAYKLIRK